ncbi:hypothetical protein V2J09_014066 [Rumex salicifolius]
MLTGLLRATPYYPGRKRCHHGLRTAKSLFMTHTVLESDSSEACRLLGQRHLITHPHPHFYLVESCWHLLDDPSWSCVVNHTRRPNNKVVDSFANSFSLCPLHYFFFYSS